MVHLTYCTRRNTRLTSHLKELHKLPQLSVRYLPSRFPTITQGATLVYLKFECLLHLMLARSSYRSLVIPVEHIIMYEKEHGVPHTREKGNSIRYSARRLHSTKSSENFFFMKKNTLQSFKVQCRTKTELKTTNPIPKSPLRMSSLVVVHCTAVI